MHLIFIAVALVACSDAEASSAAARAHCAVINAAQAGANSDITSLLALTTPLSVAQGGTGAASAAAARSALGVAAAPPSVLESVDFGQLAAHNCDDSDEIALTGVSVGDSCRASMPSSLNNNANVTCYVSSADNVRFRRCNVSVALMLNPAAVDYRCTCDHF